MISALVFVFFILGSIIGSFLNVVILRYNTGRTFGGRSGCMVCHHTLSPLELVPIFSFIFLKGRCQHCQTKISAQYIVVEFLTGLVFAGLFLKFQDLFFFETFIFTVTYAYYAMMFSLLMVIAVYDLKHKIIPDLLSFFFGLLAFVGIFFFDSFSFAPHTPSILEMLSGVFLALPFALTSILSKGTWMGMGDAKLAIGLGYLLGISRASSGVVVAFWSGALVGLVLLSFSKKYGMKSAIPFAPFLIFGTIIAFIFELHLFGF